MLLFATIFGLGLLGFVSALLSRAQRIRTHLGKKPLGEDNEFLENLAGNIVAGLVVGSVLALMTLAKP